MIVAKLYGIDSLDIDNFKTFSPESNNFSIIVEAYVGTVEQDGFDIFKFRVCTVEWLREKYKAKIVFLRDIILVPGFSYSALYERIEKLVKSISGDDWNEYATKLSHWGQWEFEDYKE